MRHFGFSMAIFFLVLVVPRTTKADAIYDIQNYPSDQNGHTVSGTITTDGNIGLLTKDDIKSWTVTFDKDTRDAYSFSSADHGAVVLVTGVQATPTSMTLSAPSSTPEENQLSLIAGGSGEAPFHNLQWVRSPTEGTYSALGETGNFLWRTSGPPMNGTDTWLIAATQADAVPEPASLGMLGIACTAGLAYGWARRRGRRP